MKPYAERGTGQDLILSKSSAELAHGGTVFVGGLVDNPGPIASCIL